MEQFKTNSAKESSLFSVHSLGLGRWQDLKEVRSKVRSILHAAGCIIFPLAQQTFFHQPIKQQQRDKATRDCRILFIIPSKPSNLPHQAQKNKKRKACVSSSATPSQQIQFKSPMKGTESCRSADFYFQHNKMITVSQGDKHLQISTNFNITFQQLQQKIRESFGQVEELQGLAYKNNQKVSFVLDEDTFNKAKANFPHRLDLVFQNKTGGEENGPHFSHSHGFKHYKGMTHDWNQEKWVDKILTRADPVKLSTFSHQERFSINYQPQEISRDIIQEIQANTKRTQRFGHSEDRVGSFLMSCYNLDAKDQSIANSDIDKSLWKLDRWRYQRIKKMENETSQQATAMPMLKLPQEARKFQGTKGSYLFSNLPIIQEQATQTGLNADKARLVGASPSPVEQNLKYYFYDQIYQNLQKLQKGTIDKDQLLSFLSDFRKFSDKDLNFAIKCFDAYIDYSQKGDIYYPPVNDKSGVLPEFGDNEIVAILGDWGTGQADSFSLIDQMVLVQGATVVIHLGDVYYAGFPEEFQKISQKINQLQAVKPNLRYYTIPGNHDYYTFGGPFYEHLERNHKDQSLNQQFGFFCLRNKSHTVQFIGLNTAKNEHSLTQPIDIFFTGTSIQKQQVSWAINRIQEFPGKTILLTHHQLFSTFQAILGSKTQMGVYNQQVNDQLSSQLFQIFPKLTCWLWGHEHRFSTYKQNSYGINRCILAGNSAFQNNQENYYEIKYSAGDITSSKYHPTKDMEGYYHHTAIIFKDFLTHKISLKYVYMTSSFDRPAVKVREEVDLLTQPNHVQVKYRKPYPIIEESGLSISVTDESEIWLHSEPVSLLFVDPTNIVRQGNVDISKDFLLKINKSSGYLCCSKGKVSQGNYEILPQSERKNYLWRITINDNTNKGTTIKTGDIFTLFNVAENVPIAKQYNSMQSLYQLVLSQIPTRFFIYTRETPPTKGPTMKCLNCLNCPNCCELM